jgi:hypothetical protein
MPIQDTQEYRQLRRSFGHPPAAGAGQGFWLQRQLNANDVLYFRIDCKYHY